MQKVSVHETFWEMYEQKNQFDGYAVIVNIFGLDDPLSLIIK